MKVKRFLFVLVFVLAFLIVGCNGMERAQKENSEQFDKDTYGLIAENEWRDNSLDEYSAAFVAPLRPSEPEGVLYGGTEQYILGNGKAAVFKKHLFADWKNNWDELREVRDDTEESLFRLAFWDDRKNQAWAVGNVWSGSGYLMMNVEEATDQGNAYRFFEVDEEMNILRSFQVRGMDEKNYELPYQMMTDVNGNVHVLTDRYGEKVPYYYAISSDGTILASKHEEFSEKEIPELFWFHDGNVGIRLNDRLFSMDHRTAKMDPVARISQSCLMFAFWDDDTIVFADEAGVHYGSISGAEVKTIYAWSNHGITFSEMLALYSPDPVEVSMLINGQDGVSYVKLVPTTEEKPITEIEFAVTNSTMQKYQKVVAAFNRDHPTFIVKMKGYNWNDESLLTRLTAGNGPTLLDTGVIGFANHADLWEPLDDFLERMGFDRELIPQIVDAGRIDGVSCGVITNFYVYTMVTMSDVPKELDYEAFLDFLDDGRYEKKAILNNVNGMDGLSFATIFFHDLDETFLYDASNCKTNFYGEGFHRVLRLARIYDRKENWPTSEELKTGESPCAVIAIQKPEDLAYFRIWGEEKLRFIGFPTQDGSLHYIAGDDQICVRKNAGEKEKRLAYTFLGYLLSPEIQRQLAIDENDPMFHLSVRWDVLDEQMAQVNGDAYPYINGFPQFHLGDDVDVQANLSTMKELLSNAKPYRGAPKELGSILREELSGYLNGDLSEENLKEHLTRRVELYLQERK